jgi:hypothetical protein
MGEEDLAGIAARRFDRIFGLAMITKTPELAGASRIRTGRL